MEMEYWWPYFKPTRRKSESGWRAFEIGYVNQNGDKLIMGQITDHIWNPRNVRFNMDLMDNGCIRFHAGLMGDGPKWDSSGYCLSSMGLDKGAVEEEVIAKLKKNSPPN